MSVCVYACVCVCVFVCVRLSCAQQLRSGTRQASLQVAGETQAAFRFTPWLTDGLGPTFPNDIIQLIYISR